MKNKTHSAPSSACVSPEPRSAKRRVARVAMAVVALFAVAGMSGCEAISDGTQTIGNAVGVKNAKLAGATGGGIVGCVLGAAGGLISGWGVGKGCATGAAVGALAGAGSVWHEQAKAAKALAAETAGTTVKVSVATEPVAGSASAAGGSGILSTSSAKPEERLKSLNLAMPTASVEARNPDVASAAKKVGKIAAMSPNGATLELSGTKAQRDWLQAQVMQGVPADAAGKIHVVAVAGSQPRIAMIPSAQAQA